MSKRVVSLLLLFFFMLCSSLFAEIIDVQIKGIDDGAKTTKQQDYKEAVLFAKREAIERAGVNIKAMTTVKDMMVESDYIETEAEAVLMPGYNILDMGYSADGIYQIVLIGKIQIETQEPSIKGSSRNTSNRLGMNFVYISPGSFMMGSPDNEYWQNMDVPQELRIHRDEKQHRVTLTKGFFMQITEVTQGQWRAVMGSNPSHFNVCGNNCPVEMVSWNDAHEFIRRLNMNEDMNKYRLPTSAEWEYAARAWSTSRFCFGDNEGSLSEYAWYSRNSLGKTHSVAQKKPNEWGLYDIHGNVFEWCQDWDGDDLPGPVTDPTGPSSGSYRVVRGGGWASDAFFCRSAFILDTVRPDAHAAALGLRLVRDP